MWQFCIHFGCRLHPMRRYVATKTIVGQLGWSPRIFKLIFLLDIWYLYLYLPSLCMKLATYRSRGGNRDAINYESRWTRVKLWVRVYYNDAKCYRALMQLALRSWCCLVSFLYTFGILLISETGEILHQIYMVKIIYRIISFKSILSQRGNLCWFVATM